LSLQRQLPIISSLQMDGSDSSRQIRRPRLPGVDEPLLGPGDLTFDSGNFVVNPLQRQIFLLLQAFPVLQDGGEWKLEGHV